ncbi:MFS transporter [Gordonia humi]|uniref:Putative MFS transporter n=1 Tax=Gordonia humi TaxID=686429 RepID=A0A840F8G2_9ACTN|nr:MFS transporter [Gordonia humi]MBB4138176.1 putative MFS transporter [Gordonia humi]
MSTLSHRALDVLDRAPLTRRYWNLAALVGVTSAVEFFDFYVIGFIGSVIGEEWGLNFGQVAMIYFAAGVGAIAGSFVGGWSGHRYGRKYPFIAGVAITGFFSGATAFAPEGAVVFVMLTRFMVGAGSAMMLTLCLTLMVEFTPSRHRTYLVPLTTTGLIPVGTMAASALSAALLPSWGWRGLAALGFAALILVVWALFAMPESPRWLVARGEYEKARTVVSKFTGQPVHSIQLDEAPDVSLGPQARTPAESGYRALFRDRRNVTFTILAWLCAATTIYGVNLWGPTFLRYALDISPAKAAEFFIYISLGALVGRVLFSVLPQWIGRRATGILTGVGGGVLLIIAGFAGGSAQGGAIALVLALAVAAMFADGGFANLAPASAEIYPTHLRSQAMGLGEVANGIGKLIGPVGLALIAGTGNMVKPEATRDALTPGFVFLGIFSLLCAVGFLFLRETRGKLEDVVSSGQANETADDAESVQVR